MSKLFNWAAARLVAAFALALPLAAMAIDYTGTDYEPWSYSAGCVAWRATESLFHASTVVDVPADGTIVEGDAYAFGTGHPWQVFASNQSAYSEPGKVLVYDVAGKTAASDAQFTPLSFGGMWVKVLQAEGIPYSITDNKTDSSDRKVELGATGASTYFKFDESFTFDRNSATKVLGTATVEIASGKTFTINQRAGKGAAVDAGNTLVLKGEGTLAVVAGLSVSGTLDLSAATVPTISGDVTLVGGSTIILPENTVVDATHPFTVCSGTLSSSGDVVYVKIGGGDPVKAFVTVSGGAITAVSTLATYLATIDGDTVFSNIAWEKDGQAATISDMSTAILEISGSGVVTGLASAPAKVTLASGVTLDATSIPAADFAAIVKSTSGTYRWTANHPIAVPQNYTYEFVGGATDAEQVTISCEPYFQNSGNLKTSGYIKFSNFWTGYTTATLDIISGQTVIDASNDKALRGTVTIRASAELVNSKTADALAYGAYTIVNVYGTLTIGSTRWTVGSNNTINMYGGTITGEGQSNNGALDFISGSSLNVNETCEITASVRFRDALTPVTVAAEKTLTLSGTIRVYSANGGVSKRGAGNLTFTTDPNNLPRGIEHQDGHLVFSTQDDVTITNTYDTAATDTRSLWYARQSNWKGTVKVAGLTGNLTWLTGAGNANSTISLQNVDNAYVIAAANSTYAIPGTLSIDGVTVFNNGSSGSTMSISNLTGSSQLVLAGWGGCSSVRYNLLNVDADWAGTLVVSNGITRTQGGTLTIGIGNIESANTNPGACVLPIANVALENTTGSVVYNLDNATLNGAAADLEVKSDGVYVRNNVTISVPVVANTTITVSVGGEPVAPATESGTTNTYSVASGATVTVTYTSDDYEVSGGSFEFTASEGYTVDTTEVVTKQYVASITTGELVVKYTSLQAAIDATAQTNSKIVLLANEEDGATIPAVDGKMFYFYAGEFTHGEIANAEGNFITTSTEEVISIGGVDVTATKYHVNAAVALVVLANEQAGTYYGDPMLAYNAFLAGPVGTTMQVFGNNPFSTEIPCTTYDSETQTYTKLEAVASITVGQVTSNYPSLADAVAAAEAGQTVTMLADDRVSFAAVTVEDGVPSGGSIVIDKNLTIDGSGFTVYGNTNADILNATGSATPGRDMVADLVDGSNLLGFFVKSGNVTFQNVTLTEFGNTAYVNKFGYTPIQTASAYTGKLTLTNVNFNKFNRTAVCVRGGTLEMTGGTVSGGTVNKNNGDYFQQPLEVRGGSATISGVTITGGDDVAGNGGGAIVAWGDTTVNNVNIDFTGIGVWADVANVAITGDDTEILATTQSVFVEEGGSATIAAGDFAGSLAVDSDENSSITVSGGTFDAAVPEEFCAEGFMPVDNGDGTYGVREDKGWIYAAPGYWNYTGTWSEGATLGEEKVTIEDDATYTASEASDGRFVTVAMTLSFDDVNDEDEGVGDAKAAVKLATGGFKVYTSEGPDGAVTSVWRSVTIEGSDMIPVADQDYKFLFVLDLTNTTYTAALITSGGAATNALVLTDGSVANIPFASRGNVAPVQKIEFIGSGSVTSIEGSYEDVPVPEGFVEDEVVTLAGDDTATLTTAQATWLNACGAKAAVAAKIATMDSTAFNNAYLLNLDITGEFGYEFKVAAIEVGDDDVTVTVSLTRTGALDETTKINGAVVLTGTDELGKTFETIDEAAVADDDFSESNTTTITLDKGDAKFFRPVIEIIAPKGE